MFKEVFGASFQAIVYRCHDLGIISDAVRRQMSQVFSEYGWRKPPYQELGASPPSKEQPRRMQRLCFRALSAGAIGESKAAEILGISVRDLTLLKDQPSAPDAGGAPRPHQRVTQIRFENALTTHAVLDRRALYWHHSIYQEQTAGLWEGGGGWPWVHHWDRFA